MVTSGHSIRNPQDLDRIGKAIEHLAKNTHIQPHGSFGMLTKESAETLVKCGLKRINHNLETSEAFFPKVCSTHTYQERINTIRVAKAAGWRYAVAQSLASEKAWKTAWTSLLP